MVRKRIALWLKQEHW